MKRSLVVMVILMVLIGIGYWVYKAEKDAKMEPREIAPESHRILNSGELVGYREDNGSHAWLGIPYAKAPVGELRWKAPQPHSWSGVLTALAPGAICSQIGGPLAGNLPKSQMDQPVGSEDCLFLNIWAPEFAIQAVPTETNRLPVMFWIHGGGNSIGHGAGYNGKVLAQKYHVIVVSINYRLGPLGWFYHPALERNGDSAEDRSGNYGTLDIIQALRWVHQNIEGFGGDPRNVTVFGESAGGRNTLSMLLSPLARGLFHRAIVQSGSPLTSTMAKASHYRDDSEPGHRFSSREIVTQLLITDGIVSDRQTAKSHQERMSPTEIATYLRSKRGPDLLAAYQERVSGMLAMPQLFRDGYVIPAADAMEIFKNRHQYNAVPVILGTNRDEFKLFMALHPTFVTHFLGFLPRIKDDAWYHRYAAYKSDAWKVSGVDEIARLLREGQGASVYAYRFDWDEEPSILGTDLGKLLGAAHGIEIPFVFNNPDAGFVTEYVTSKENTPGREALADAMSSYWTEFAYTGTPGKGRNADLPEWTPWDNSSARAFKMMVFDTPTDDGIRMSSISISVDDLKARLLADTGFSDQKSHCQMYVDLFGSGEVIGGNGQAWQDEEYAHLGHEGCAAYPRGQFETQGF